ncbi:hypothetical protein ACROYT_G007212 [Oculina patagonica]
MPYNIQGQRSLISKEYSIFRFGKPSQLENTTAFLLQQVPVSMTHLRTAVMNQLHHHRSLIPRRDIITTTG